MSSAPDDPTGNNTESEYFGELKRKIIITSKALYPKRAERLRSVSWTRFSNLDFKKMLEKNIKISKYRARSDDELVGLFSYENILCHCNNIVDLFKELSIPYKPEEWKLFVNASLYSMKAVLQHMEILFLPIPLFIQQS